MSTAEALVVGHAVAELAITETPLKVQEARTTRPVTGVPASSVGALRAFSYVLEGVSRGTGRSSLALLPLLRRGVLE
jgi:RNA 3'-terminal phosphate cyclase